MTRDINYTAKLDPSGFEKGTSGILSGLNALHGRMLGLGNSMQQSVDGVTSKWSGLATVLAGLGASLGIVSFASMIRGAIDGAAKLHDLSQSTGMAVGSLSALASVGKTSETSVEAIAAASNKLSKNMASADEKAAGAAQAIKALGLNLDEFQAMSPEARMQAAAKAMANFEDGASKTAVAMALFGKEGAQMLPFLNDLAATGELQARVTAEQAAQADNFTDNLIKLKASGEGWKKELALGMLPALNEASEAALKFMNGTGGLREEIRKLAADGTLVEWTRTGIRGLTYMLDGIQYLGRGFKFVGEMIAASAAQLAQLVQGNLTQAMAIGQDFNDRMLEMFSADTIGQRLRANLDEVKGKVEEIVKPRQALTFHATVEHQKKTPRDPSQMPVYEEQLAQEKRLAAERDALRDYTKQQEVVFWQDVLAREGVTANDRIAIMKKVADLQTQILREEARKKQAVDAEVLKGQQDKAMDAVEMARLEAQGQYEVGLISKEQLLNLERGFEEQRTQIRREYLQARLAMIDRDRDPVTYEQISQQIEELERQHLMRMRQIQVTQLADSPFTSVMKTAEQSFAGAIEGMINRTMTLRQALTSIWAGIRGAIVKEIATIIARKVAAWAVERALTIAGIGADAAKAGSGAAASVASIPYVGPILALAALATVMAAVGGASGKVPSAARGFDIPTGMNPMTQLHQEEMVLPAEIANTIRGLVGGGGAVSGGGGGGGGGGFGGLNVHPLPGGWYGGHQDEFVRFFKQLQRNGYVS